MADLTLQNQSHRYNRYFVDLGKIYQTKKGRIYTGIIFSLITIIFFIIFAIRPTLITIAQLIKQTKDQKLVVTELEKKINNLAEAQKNYLTIGDDLNLVEEALPNKANLPLLTKEIETLARQAGISIINLRFNDINLLRTGTPQEGRIEVLFSFNGLGDYQNLKTFLNSLTTLRRILSIESFSFQSGKESSNILSLNINGKAWFMEKP
jgi:Tfp pilus assembly protein PilO